MIKLIFTMLTLTTSPGAPPSATSATSAVDFASSEACRQVLDAAKRQGEHTVAVRGVSVTLRWAGGRCVEDGVGPAQGRGAVPGEFDPFGVFGR